MAAKFSNAIASIDEERGQGMDPGWFVDPLPGGMRAIAHGGEVDGHSAGIAFFRDLNTGLVILRNQGGSSAEDLIRRIMALANWMCR